MIKVLFFIHDLGPGGAEKVLVNLANNLDKQKFDVTILSLFDEGINKQYIQKDVHYKYVFKKMFRGNSHLLKLFSPEALHKLFIKDTYDIEIAFLEGPCSRIISGCKNKKTKLISWIHIQQFNSRKAAVSFRTFKEALSCYNKFDVINCVSEGVKNDFLKIMPVNTIVNVLYNVVDTDQILEKSKNRTTFEFQSDKIKLVAVGKLLKSKGFDKIVNIVYRLKQENINVDAFFLGDGPEKSSIKRMISDFSLHDNIHLLGYQSNPYKYIANCDLFICASEREGFSTATTEALILGLPVCSLNVAGMKEMLGENNEYGVIVENIDELYDEVKKMVTNTQRLNYYKDLAKERGKMFVKTTTLKKIESLLENL